jgi:periplasmic divalent cation tolerance protein
MHGEQRLGFRFGSHGVPKLAWPRGVDKNLSGVRRRRCRPPGQSVSQATAFQATTSRAIGFEGRLGSVPIRGGFEVSEQQYCQVVTTIDAHPAARELARGAIEARLAACAQVAGPIESIYRWQGEVASAQEWQVVFKTTTDRYADLEAHIRGRHGYDVPEILCTPISTGSRAYLEWLSTGTQPA